MKYLKLKFKLEFEKKVKFTVLPSFIFRSVIGKELRNFCCLFTNRQECKECSINNTCVYAKLFETHIDKGNSILKGRTRGSHPFILYSDSSLNTLINKIDLIVTLIGEESSEYISYMFYAIRNAGNSGIFRERVKFRVKDITTNGHSLLTGNNIDTETITYNEWKLNVNKNLNNKFNIHIGITTPLRMKIMGKYVDNFSVKEIIRAAYRRLSILSSFYGDNNLGKINFEDRFYSITNKKLRWIDMNYYSSRQSNSIKLGGIIGFIEVKGCFSNEEISLLKGGELFHLGKNTGFGLGKIKLNIEKN